VCLHVNPQLLQYRADGYGVTVLIEGFRESAGADPGVVLLAKGGGRLADVVDIVGDGANGKGCAQGSADAVEVQLNSGTEGVFGGTAHPRYRMLG